MPIHPDTLREFEEGESNNLYLLSHYPPLTDEDVSTVASSVLKKVKNAKEKLSINLDLGDNNITDAGIRELKLCSSVFFDSVNLGGNQLSDESIPVLSSLRIQSLDLSDNPISDSSISSILESNIQHIALRGTKVTEEGILSLLKSEKIQSIYINIEDYSQELMERVESFNRKNDKEKKDDDSSKMLETKNSPKESPARSYFFEIPKEKPKKKQSGKKKSVKKDSSKKELQEQIASSPSKKPAPPRPKIERK